MDTAQAAEPCPTQMQGLWAPCSICMLFIWETGKPLSQALKSEAVFEMWTYHLRHSVPGVVCLGVKYI